MRIALIGPVYPYRGGIAHYTMMLDQTLRAAGHEVLLISFKRQYPQWLFPGKSDRDPSARALKTDDARFILDLFDPTSWLRAYRAIARFRPDRLVLQWWTPYWAPVWQVLGWLNRQWLHVPLVYVCHNVLPHERRRGQALAVRTTLRWGDAFVVHSEDQRRQLLTLLPGASVVVRSHPVYDMFVGDAAPSRAEARNRLGLPAASEAPVLLFFGIVRPYKGLDVLLEAMPALRAELGDVTLLVAGEFWEDRRRYEGLIAQHSLQGAVSIRDAYIPNEEVPTYFAAADLLVAPYIDVTGSGVVRMAMGFGLPYVATWEEPTEPGFDVPHAIAAPRDPKALAEAICRLHHDLAHPPAAVPTNLSPDSLASWQDMARIVTGAELLKDAA